MDTSDQPHLSYEWFRDEMMKALRLETLNPEREGRIRELWDMARDAGQRAAEAARDAR
jgi:hypothetical protein